MSQKVFIPLEDVRVASPCHADWEMMDGNERVKLCGSCQKNVYNLSEMTRLQAEDLIAEHEGEMCVRYYQRADGTIMTQDCPVGLALARRVALAPFKYLATGAAFLLAYGACVFGYRASVSRVAEQGTGGTLSHTLRPFKFLTKLVSPTHTPPMMLMGAAPMRPLATPTPRATATPAFTEVMGDIAMPASKNPPGPSKTQE